MIRRFTIVPICLLVAGSLYSQQIYWKKDHIYRGPGGKEIAIVTPLPTDQTAPTAPTNLRSTSVGQTSVTVAWDASTDSGGSGLAAYKIYRGNLPVGTVTALSFTDKPLRLNTTFTYTIVAFDNAQNHSVASNTITITTAP